MTKEKLIVYYDSYCPLCIKIKNSWEKIDIFNKVSFTSFRDKKVLENLPIPLMELEKEIYSKIDNNHNYYRGMDTFIQMNKRIPLLYFTVPILILFKKIGIGQILYRYIADKRKILPNNHCVKESCKLL